MRLSASVIGSPDLTSRINLLAVSPEPRSSSIISSCALLLFGARLAVSTVKIALAELCKGWHAFALGLHLVAFLTRDVCLQEAADAIAGELAKKS